MGECLNSSIYCGRWKNVPNGRKKLRPTSVVAKRPSKALKTLITYYSDKLAPLQVVINCQYSVAQMCTREDTLGCYLGMLSSDDIVSHNTLITLSYFFRDKLFDFILEMLNLFNTLFGLFQPQVYNLLHEKVYQKLWIGKKSTKKELFSEPAFSRLFSPSVLYSVQFKRFLLLILTSKDILRKNITWSLLSNLGGLVRLWTANSSSCP